MNNDPFSTNPQNPPPAGQPEPAQPVYKDWREMRQAAREARRQQMRAWRSSGPFGWIGGAVLIFIGLVFLMQNLTGYFFENWWALFIMIPALSAFASALHNFQTDHRLNAYGRGSLIIGVLLSLITIMFLFNLTFVYLGPVILILAGVAILVSALLPR
jgi:hypothetical protein